jgi:hypothetical protein
VLEITSVQIFNNKNSSFIIVYISYNLCKYFYAYNADYIISAATQVPYRLVPQFHNLHGRDTKFPLQCFLRDFGHGYRIATYVRNQVSGRAAIKN